MALRAKEVPCLDTLVQWYQSSAYTFRNGTSMPHAQPAGVFWWVWNFNSGMVGGMTWYNEGLDRLREGVMIKWCGAPLLQRPPLHSHPPAPPLTCPVSFVLHLLPLCQHTPLSGCQALPSVGRRGA